MSLARWSSLSRSRASLLVGVVLVCAALAATVAALRPDRFTARVPVLVDVTASSPAAGASAPARAALLATQADIVTSGRVALKVVDRLRLAGDAGARPADPAGGVAPRFVAADRLLSGLRVQASVDSGVLEIAFTADDPAFAARTADGFAAAYVETLAEIRADANRRALQEGTDPRASGLTRLDATVLDVARPPQRADGPGPLLAAVLALPAGLLLALVAATIAERRSPRLHAAADLQRLLPGVTVELLRAAATAAPAGGRVAAAGARVEADGVETGIFAPSVADTAARRARAADRARAGGGARSAGVAAASHEAVCGDEGVAEPVAMATEAGGAGPTVAAAAPAPATRDARAPIGQMLVQAGLIHPPEVERTLAWARQEGLRFGEAAIARRLVTPDQLDRVLAEQFQYPRLQSGRGAVRPQVVAAYDSRDPVLADLRRLRARLDGVALARDGRHCVAVVGAGAGAGRSFVAANLAVSLAQAGRRTLLIDADLRGGRLNEWFGLPERCGLSSMLNRRIEAGALQPVPGLGPLTVIAAGPPAPNPAELLSRDTFGQLLDSFRRAFDAIVFDTHGALDEPDARLVARAAGAAVLVTRRGATLRDEAAQRIQELQDDRVVVSATVLNLH